MSRLKRLEKVEQYIKVITFKKCKEPGRPNRHVFEHFVRVYGLNYSWRSRSPKSSIIYCTDFRAQSRFCID